jgi:hypothetical protein
MESGVKQAERQEGGECDVGRLIYGLMRSEARLLRSRCATEAQNTTMRHENKRFGQDKKGALTDVVGSGR